MPAKTITSDPTRLSRYVVPATVMLSFVSFWRAAAIVLNDLGSTAYYIGGITETAIGKAAPWFILGIMLFSYAVRAVYVESCSMFVRGGVYRVVREAMGGTAAKFSVSALMFDYVLTGPISAVSAGLYLAGLINQTADYFHYPKLPLEPNYAAAVFAIAVTVYFWWTNTVGIPFSSGKALRIMQITTVMVVTLIAWCLLTIVLKGYQPVPAPVLANLKFGKDSLGWLKGTIAPSVTAIAVLVGLGHSLLAMSGEESLAQVNREIEYPKHQNLMRTGFIIFAYSMVFTSLVSFFAVMIIPDAQRAKYFDNLISGLAMSLVGPEPLRLFFQAFVVLVGTLILAGAVNTSIIGSNGVLNRVAEDGVLPIWFLNPHPKYGTTHRIIKLIVGLQLVTIVISRGNVLLLGEAYAFGVAWSFFMKALAVLVLRFKQPEVERWRVPFNLRIGSLELPIGLVLITTMLFLLAGINVLTKTTATISGGIFTIVFFTAFSLSERHFKNKEAANKDAPKSEESETELFRLEVRDDLSPRSLSARPENILVAVHNAENLSHLEKTLELNDPAQQDVIVLSVNGDCPDAEGETLDQPNEVLSQCETRIFSKVVYVAEKCGKPAKLIAVPGKNAYELILLAAYRLQSDRVIVSLSEKVDVMEQERQITASWIRLSQPRPNLTVEIVPDGEEPPYRFRLDRQLTIPSQSDQETVRRLWKAIAKDGVVDNFHESDIFGVALRKLEYALNSGAIDADQIFRKETKRER